MLSKWSVDQPNHYSAKIVLTPAIVFGALSATSICGGIFCKILACKDGSATK